METDSVDGRPRRQIIPNHKALPEAAEKWFLLRRKVEHHGLPTVVDAEIVENATDGILEVWHGARTLREYLDSQANHLPELSAVYISLQTAIILDQLLRAKADLPILDTSEFVVDEAEDGLPRIVFLGWRPPEFVPEGSWEPDALQFLARLLYFCLTGTKPPSEQVSEMSPDLEETNLGFDDLFLNWVTEEKNLGALGEAALKALRPSESDCRLATFIADVYPHLKRATNEAIDEAMMKLAADRALLIETEKHRQALKEQRSRQHYLTNWMNEHRPQIEEESRDVESKAKYLEALQAFSREVRRKLTAELKSNGTTKEFPELTAAEANESKDIDAPIAFEPAPADPLDFSDLARNIKSSEADFDATLDGDSVAVGTTAEKLTSAQSEKNNDGRYLAKNRMMVLVVLIIIIATLVGVFSAWSLLSYKGKKSVQNEIMKGTQGDGQ